MPFLVDCWQKYGDTIRLDLGYQDAVLAVHPDDVETVLTSRDGSFIKGTTYDELRRMVGNGMLTLEGAAWKRRRQLQQPHFQPRSLARLAETMVRVTAHTLDQLRAEHPEGGVIEAHAEMTRLTMEIVSQALFGSALGDDGERSRTAMSDALAFVSNRHDRAILPPLWLPTPGNLRMRRALANIDAIVGRLVTAERERGPGDAESGPATLLRMLVHARDAETGQALTDREIRDEVVTLFLAGHETSAVTLCWAFVLLAGQEAVVERMREEVNQALGDRLPCAEDAARLPYLRMVIEEVLRLRPPVWLTARDATVDCTLGGFSVDAGTRVILPPYLTHRHPAFWRDPELFDPERFSPAQRDGRPRGAWFPFSSGPRVCIGQGFAMIELQLVLAMLLQRGSFQLATKAAIGCANGLTLRPEGPVPVRIDWHD